MQFLMSQRSNDRTRGEPGDETSIYLHDIVLHVHVSVGSLYMYLICFYRLVSTAQFIVEDDSTALQETATIIT